MQILKSSVHRRNGYNIIDIRGAVVFLVLGGTNDVKPGFVCTKPAQVGHKALSMDFFCRLIREELGSTVQREIASALSNMSLG